MRHGKRKNLFCNRVLGYRSTVLTPNSIIESRRIIWWYAMVKINHASDCFCVGYWKYTNGYCVNYAIQEIGPKSVLQKRFGPISPPQSARIYFQDESIPCHHIFLRRWNYYHILYFLVDPVLCPAREVLIRWESTLSFHISISSLPNWYCAQISGSIIFSGPTNGMIPKTPFAQK